MHLMTEIYLYAVGQNLSKILYNLAKLWAKNKSAFF